MGAPQEVTNDFYFPADLALDQSVTRKHYEAVLRGMTHKANNFLAVIQGFSTLILMQEDLDPETRENLEHVKEAGQNSSKLYERTLLCGGCATVSLQEIRLGEFLPLAESDFVGVCERNGVNFKLNMEPTVPEIRADAGLLKMILVELISNAAEAAGKAGGEMALDVLSPGQATMAEENRVDFFVRNTGSEIPPDQLENVFKPFFTTKESDHFGVGLSIAGVLAHQCGMKLGVQSANSTTTFWLSSPAV